jgi:hypothetical protein
VKEISLAAPTTIEERTAAITEAATIAPIETLKEVAATIDFMFFQMIQEQVLADMHNVAS